MTKGRASGKETTGRVGMGNTIDDSSSCEGIAVGMPGGIVRDSETSGSARVGIGIEGSSVGIIAGIHKGRVGSTSSPSADKDSGSDGRDRFCWKSNSRECNC